MKKSLCAFALCTLFFAVGVSSLAFARETTQKDGALSGSSEKLAARKDSGKAGQGTSSQASRKAPPANVSGECAWMGKRVLSLLSRDDVDQANRFMSFYKQFGCKEGHIGPSFRCVISDNAADPLNAEDMAARVDRCWNQSL